MRCELEHWENVRRDMKYPKEDNNNGYVYGLHILLNDEIIDVEWFKTEEERAKIIKDNHLVVVNN